MSLLPQQIQIPVIRICAAFSYTVQTCELEQHGHPGYYAVSIGTPTNTIDFKLLPLVIQ